MPELFKHTRDGLLEFRLIFDFVIFAPSRIMDVYITYQQDTAKTKSLVLEVPESNGLSGIMDREGPGSILDIPEREQAVEVPQKETYTPFQVNSVHHSVPEQIIH